MNDFSQIDLPSVYLSVNCRYFIINRYQETYYLNEIFKFSATNDITNISLGYWTEDNGFSFQRIPNYYKNKDNFENSLINGCIFNVRNFIIVNSIYDTSRALG